MTGKNMIKNTQMGSLTTIQSPIGKQFSNANVRHKLLPLLIYAIQSLQNDQELFVGKIRLKDFIENANYKTDKWDVLKKHSSTNGYQRIHSFRKAELFGRFMQNQSLNFTPSSLYLNIRDTDLNKVKITEVDSKASLFKILIQSDAKIWVVDGQHRIEGLRQVVDITNDPDIELPVVLTVGISKQEEMLQFVTINKARASVKTDLAERDLADFASKNRQFASDLQNRKNIVVKDLDFIESATSVMDGLYQTSGSPWYNRILMPNQKKNDQTTVSSATFVDSLEPLMKKYLGKSKKKPDAVFGPYDDEKIIRILNNVWKGIKLVNPEMFERKNLCKYVIQHTIGTMAIHGILNKMFQNAKTEKLVKATSEDFKKLFNITSLKPSHKHEWDKEYGDHGGKFTTYGTNKKSFNIIENILWKQIRDTPTWKKYKD